jgi:glycosyltransferase involved in cell wall biosynthesis
VGVDSARWNLPKAARIHDFLVYDKIRWYRDERVPAIRDRLIERLAARGHSVTVLQYGAHHQGEFRQALATSRALLFLCEHETQGIAYQEAMAAGVPVLAWDEGELVDPSLRHYAPDLKVTSVPYFDERCGMRFKLETFEEVSEQFWMAIDRFTPRDYVDERLSMSRAGRDYLSLYSSIAG